MTQTSSPRTTVVTGKPLNHFPIDGALIFIYDKLLQLSKAPSPMLFMGPRNSTVDRLLQYAKAPIPILDTNGGIVIEVKDVQPTNGPSISVTEFGSSIEVKEVQFAKALSSILVTEFGIITDDKFIQLSNVPP